MRYMLYRQEDFTYVGDFLALVKLVLRGWRPLFGRRRIEFVEDILGRWFE